MGEKLYNPNDGVQGRQGGPYLDQVHIREAEEQAALREGREPNFKSPSTFGTVPLVTEDQLLRDGVMRGEITAQELRDFNGVKAAALVERPDAVEEEEVERPDAVEEEEEEDESEKDKKDALEF